MTKKFPTVKLLSTCLGAALVLSGCSQKSDPNPGPTSVATPAVSATAQEADSLGSFADPAVKEKAAALTASYSDKGFPKEAFKDKETGPALLYLAATSENPAIQLEALKKLSAAYTNSSDSDTQAQTDANYDKVVLHFLNNGDDAQLYWALMAAKKSFRDGADPAILQRLIVIGSSDSRPAARFATMTTFGSMGSRADNSEVVDLYLRAYKDEPETAQIALKWTGSSFGRTNQREDIKTALLQLIKHENPAVRGEAVYALSRTFNDETAMLIEQSQPLLTDKSPYVRAKALEALSFVKDPEVLNLMVPLLNDTAKTDYRLSITNLLGQTANQNYTTFGWSQVNGMAVKSIERASAVVDRKNPFEAGKIEHKTREADVGREAARAKTWVAANVK